MRLVFKPARNGDCSASCGVAKIPPTSRKNCPGCAARSDWMALAMTAAWDEFDEIRTASGWPGKLVKAISPSSNPCQALGLGLFTENSDARSLVLSHDASRLAKCQSCAGAMAAA